jgi:Fe2+ or Zn2+ uptake regulation protein
MKISKEELYHFNCRYCGKWWSIGDAPIEERKDWWYCPWCGERQDEDKAMIRLSERACVICCSNTLDKDFVGVCSSCHKSTEVRARGSLRTTIGAALENVPVEVHQCDCSDCIPR